MTYQQEDPAHPVVPSRPRRLSALRSRRFRARVRWAGPFALGVLATFLAAMLYGVAVPGPQPLSPGDVNRSIASALASQTAPPADALRVYRAVAPSLVVIQAQVVVVSGGSNQMPIGVPVASAAASLAAGASPGAGATAGASGSSPGATPAVPGASPGAPQTDLGSGVVVDTAGDILTCLHVVANATSIQVTFADGTTSPATIVNRQPQNDIAVLQASQPPANLVPAVLGNPRSVQVGSEAFVLGNPFGLDGSMSSGVVSGLNRSFQLPNNGPTLTGLIQIDAAVNPGNSGGPLVNRDGQVVGIVSALINPTNQGVFIGIGLAVPIDVAGGAAGLPQY